METAPGMMMEIAIGVALLVAGLLLGLFIGRSRGDAGTRIRDLEREVERLRQEGARYREQVAQHFGDTSDKFRDLTTQYAHLYKHLAKGARDLCGDVPAIRFDQRALLESDAASTPTTADDEASEKPIAS